ncbi:MAG: ATP synthase F1 subunit epsilon [Thermoguttaceae bacterium]
MNCIVVTPDKTVVDTEAVFVALPLFDGEYGVLPGHTPMVGRLGAGELRIKTPDGKTDNYFVENGFVEVIDDTVNLMTGRAVPVSEIDIEEAETELATYLAQAAKTVELQKIRQNNINSRQALIRLAKKN